MHIVAILIIGAVMRGAWDHLRADYRRSRDQKVKAAAKKAPGGKLTKAAKRKALRRHATGYWAGEISRGFPVTRTGWHAGWLAHKTAAEHQRAVRDAAQTTHLETVAQFAPGRAEAKRRHEALRKEISETLGQAPEGQRTGRKAAQKAADEVAAKRAERRRQKAPPNDTGGTCIHCGATDGAECLPGCPYREGDWRTVARNTKQYRKNGHVRGQPSASVVIDTPVRVHNAEDSDWLRPGEPRCEGCGGRGSALGGTCPACRGFGSAPASPLSPLAPSGAICGACGHGEKRGDPVLAAQGGYNIHLSHAKEQQEAYWEALNRMRRQENEPGPDASRSPQPVEGEIDDAVIAADHGYEGEYELAPSPTTASPTTTEGAPPVSDTNVKSVTAAAVGFTAQTEGDAVAYAQRRQQAEQHLEEMQAAGVDSETLSDQMDLVDRLKEAEEAVKAVPEQATVVSTGLQKRHGGIDAAVDDAPIAQAAQPTFYGNG